VILDGDLFYFLTTDAGVAAIIASRCYPVSLPQPTTFPALSYSQVDAVRVRNVDGPAGKVRRRISVNSWALSDIEVWQLAEAVRAALDGFDGMMGSSEIGSIILVTEIPFFEEEAGTVGVHRVMQDYQIGHKEA
jgi:hypothetical protein